MFHYLIVRKRANHHSLAPKTQYSGFTLTDLNTCKPVVTIKKGKGNFPPKSWNHNPNFLYVNLRKIFAVQKMGGGAGPLPPLPRCYVPACCYCTIYYSLWFVHMRCYNSTFYNDSGFLKYVVPGYLSVFFCLSLDIPNQRSGCHIIFDQTHLKLF